MNMKKIFQYILLGIGMLAIAVPNSYAQEQPSLRQRADRLYQQMEYAKALSLYAELMSAKNTKLEDMERVAASYLYLNQYALAEQWFSRAMQNEGHSKETMLGYAEALKHNGKYAEAKQVFMDYNAKFGHDDQVAVAIIGCDSAIVWMADPLPYDLKNEQQVNTDLAEFSAVPTSNGVIYTAEPKTADADQSGMTGQTYLRVFSASRDLESLRLPSIMPNSFNVASYHVGPVAVNKDENVLYVTRTYVGSKTQKYKEDGRRFRKHNLELLIYKNEGSSWVSESFPYNDVAAYSVGHAAISDDEQKLYFVSDMPGGYGGTDIWFCERNSDVSWGQPQNAGAMINSTGNEKFPSVYGDKLYYSSDGFVGMGGLDVFVAKGSGSQFSDRRNLRYPINTAADDFGYAVMADDDDAFYGYLSSNRKGGVGSDDIYSFYFEKPKVKITLRASTYETSTNVALPGVRVTLLGKGEAIIARNTTDSAGTVTFELNKATDY